MFASLWPHELQHARLPCSSLSPGVCSDSCPLCQWCHPTISFSVAPFPSCPQSFPASGSFLMSAFCIRWPRYWRFSFSIRPSSEYSGLISFRLTVLGVNLQGDSSPCCPRDSQVSSLAPQFESINSMVLSLLYGPTLTFIHDYWKKHSFDYMYLFQQSDTSAF